MSRTDGMHSLVEQLLAERTARTDAVAGLRTDTATLRKDFQSAHAAMSKEQTEKLAAARTQLAEMRRQMSAQTADFRRNVQMAHQTTAKAMREKLMAERTHLATETTQLIQQAATRLAEIQADTAGVAAAWRMMTTGQPPATEASSDNPTSSHPASGPTRHRRRK